MHIDDPSVLEILGLHGLSATLFLTSAWLFRKAAHERPPAVRRTES